MYTYISIEALKAVNFIILSAIDPVIELTNLKKYLHFSYYTTQYLTYFLYFYNALK